MSLRDDVMAEQWQPVVDEMECQMVAAAVHGLGDPGRQLQPHQVWKTTSVGPSTFQGVRGELDIHAARTVAKDQGLPLQMRTTAQLVVEAYEQGLRDAR